MQKQSGDIQNLNENLYQTTLLIFINQNYFWTISASFWDNVEFANSFTSYNCLKSHKKLHFIKFESAKVEEKFAKFVCSTSIKFFTYFISIFNCEFLPNSDSSSEEKLS